MGVEEVNELMAKKNHDYYKPRKCSVTNRLLGSKDHASVQINVGRRQVRHLHWRLLCLLLEWGTATEGGERLRAQHEVCRGQADEPTRVQVSAPRGFGSPGAEECSYQLYQ